MSRVISAAAEPSDTQQKAASRFMPARCFLRGSVCACRSPHAEIPAPGWNARQRH